MNKKLLNLCLTALLSAVSTAAWALSEVNGVYQIGTAEDYAEFVALVNGGEKGANAILTADIDLGTNNTKIGRNNNGYLGYGDANTVPNRTHWSKGPEGTNKVPAAWGWGMMNNKIMMAQPYGATGKHRIQKPRCVKDL